MATFLAAKGPTEVVRRVWAIPVDSDDGAQSVSVSASGVTVDSSALEGDDLALTISGGTAAATGTITATITTSRGRTLIETLYIPVVASAAQIAETARDYCYFALRKVVGNGNDPDAAELTDALDRLSALIASLRKGGADIGCAFPLTANTVIYCPDWAVQGLRYGLLLDCYSQYGAEPSAMDVEKAQRGLQIIKHNNLPAVRDGVSYS